MNQPEVQRSTPDFSPAGGRLVPLPFEGPLSIQSEQCLQGFQCFFGVQSRFLQQAHDIFVSFPPGYDQDPSRNYPVLYVHDGRNVFDGLHGQGGSPVKWGLDSAIQALTERGTIDPPIVVAIGQTDARNHELLHDAHPAIGEALGQDYMRFVVSELRPLVNERFRTRTDSQDTAIAGASLGGSISLYAAMEYGLVFGKLGSLSPSLYYRGMQLLHRAEAGELQGCKVWTSYGTAEETRPEHTERFEHLLSILDRNHGERDRDFRAGFVRGGKHEEATWRILSYRMLQFLFSRD